jgi:glycosyltransferase involved in cell wall biosynthesis
MAQSWPGIEAIVVDDGSTEDVAPAVAEQGPRARLIRQANAGVTAARNKGLSAASGEYIAFLDSDDWWDADKVAAQVGVLAARPDVVLVWTDMRAVDEQGAVVAPDYLRYYYDSAYARPELAGTLPNVATLGDLVPDTPELLRTAPVRIGDIFGAMLYGNLVHTSTALFRRQRVVDGGGFDPALARSGEDYEFHWRTSWFGPAALIDTPLVSYRVGAGDQLSSNRWAFERAHNAFIAVSYWIEAAAGELGESPRAIRHRLAELEQWCGERKVLLGESGGVPYLLRSLRGNPWPWRTWALAGLGILPTRLRMAMLSTWKRRPDWMRRAA